MSRSRRKSGARIKKHPSGSTPATPIRCSQCKAKAIGQPAHVGRPHQACGIPVYSQEPDHTDEIVRLDEVRTKGDGSPRDGGRWVSA